MQQLQYSVRRAKLSDVPKIMVLYRSVAASSGGIARQADEVTETYEITLRSTSLEELSFRINLTKIKITLHSSF